MGIKQGAISLDVENSIASLLGFRKIVYKNVKIHLRKLLILWLLVLLTLIVMCYLVLRIIGITQTYYILLI